MKIIFLIVLSSIVFCACSENDKDDGLPNDPPQKPTSNQNQFTKLGDLSLVEYRSSSCTAKISGVDEPKQLLISYNCGYTSRAHTLICDSDFLCTGTYGDYNNKIEVGLSENFKQVIAVWYNKDSSIADSENFEIIDKVK